MDGMSELLEKAEANGLWLKGKYSIVLLSPKELLLEQSNGNFRWGADSWMLVDPKEQINFLNRELLKIEKRKKNLECRIAEWEASK